MAEAAVARAGRREVRLSEPRQGPVRRARRDKGEPDGALRAGRRAACLRTTGGRPGAHAAFSAGAGGPSFFQKRVPETRRSGCRRRRSRRSTARRRARWSIADLAHVPGRSTSAASASTSGRTAPRIPSTATSCASTSTRSRAPDFDDVRRRPRSSRRCSTRLGDRRLSEDDRQPRAARLRPAAAALGLLRRAGRGRGGRARARAPPPRRPHRGLVEGGARRRGSSSTTTRTRRTRPSSAPGRSVRGPAARSPRRCAGTRSSSCTPTS
jgi:hypothetical protein